MSFYYVNRRQVAGPIHGIYLHMSLYYKYYLHSDLAEKCFQYNEMSDISQSCNHVVRNTKFLTLSTTAPKERKRTKNLSIFLFLSPNKIVSSRPPQPDICPITLSLRYIHKNKVINLKKKQTYPPTTGICGLGIIRRRLSVSIPIKKKL